jgi:hypothetical protein
MYQLTICNLEPCSIHGFCMVLTAIISLNSVNQLIFVMVKCDVLFEVRTEFLNNIYTCFDFKGLNRGFISLNSVNQLIFVMVKCGVLFEVRTEFLNIN